MELPSRPKNDRYTRPGQYRELEQRLRVDSPTVEQSDAALSAARLAEVAKVAEAAKAAEAAAKTREAELARDRKSVV